MLELTTPVKFVKRVGERVGAALAERGGETVEDLLYHLPFRYEDRLNPQPMAELVAVTMASVIGEVRGSVLLRTRAGPIFEMTLGQGLGTVKCMWFHGAYLKDRFKLGQTVAVYGKLEPSRSAMAAAAAISGATTNSFSVNNAAFSSVGQYSVVITNAYGSITSAVATLQVVTPTLIDVAFTSATVTGKT